MRSILQLALISALVFSPVYSSGAETLKLRYLQSVTADDKEGQISNPEGVTCNNKAMFIVADTGNGRLLRYTFQDRKLKGGTEIKLPEVTSPLWVQMNSKEEIYVLDGNQRRIARLNPDGTFGGYFAPQGVTAPSTYVTKSFKIDVSDNIYLLDILGQRVMVFDPSGKMLRQVPFPGEVGFISDLTVTPGGDILLLDSIKDSVFIAQKDSPAFKPLTKALREYVKFPTYMTSDSRGTIYLVDHNGGAIVALGLDGSFLGRQLELGWKNGLVYYPSQVCMTNDGDFFVADRGNNRVQIFERLK